MQLRLDPTSPSGVSIVNESPTTSRRQGNGYVSDKITGKIIAGTNVTLTGSGTSSDPYRISASGSGGGGGGQVDTVVAGTGITVDATDPVNPVVATTITQYTDEQVRDVIGTALVAGSNVTITPDDAANTITIAASGGGGGGTDDQTAAEVPFTPTGSIAATNVQTALAELDTEKAAASHSHTSSNITDFNTAVDGRIANVVGAAPAALDTLDELAAALGDDANFASTVTTSLAGKANTSHTHTASNVTDFSTAADARITAQKGAASGVASLDAATRIPIAQLPTSATANRILKVGTASSSPTYAQVTLTTDVTGSLPVANGGTGRATATTAYGLIAAGTTATGAQQTIAPGTSGQFLKSAGTAALASFATITKTDVGLANVDNTSDAAKPVSTATQTALDGKAATSHTHTASQVTDFQTTVSANTDVAANTAARHTHSNSAVLNATTASFTTADETKLDGIATGATANDSDANLLNRANHTGSQAQSTITNLTTDLAAKSTETTRSASGMGYVNHGATASTARPTGYAGITWIGTVEPTNAVDGDIWYDQ